MSLRFVDVMSGFPSFLRLNYIPLYVDIHFMYQSINGYLSYLYLLASGIINKSVFNIIDMYLNPKCWVRMALTTSGSKTEKKLTFTEL